jgi:hypothetical protein
LLRAGRIPIIPALTASGALLCLSVPALAAAADSAERQPLTVIEAGIPVEEPGRDRWNRVVLLATPRFSSGDTDAVSKSIRQTVSGFTWTVLATVRPVEADDEPDSRRRRHEIVEVGVGYAMPVDGQLTIVAPDRLPKGVALDFLGRKILGAQQKSLADVEAVGTHPEAVVFDAPTLMLRDQDHEELVVRHLVRLDPRSGRCATCTWLIDAATDDAPRPLDEPPRLVEEGTREERAIHVDGSRFTLGFPTKQAFAVESLPPGRKLDWSAAFRTSAARAAYPRSEVEALVAAADAAISDGRPPRTAARDGGATQ